MGSLRVAAVVVVASFGLASPGPAGDGGAQESAPSPGRAPARSRRPVRDSIERVVEKVVEAHLKPCDRAAQQGVPCFPVSVEQEGPRFSVAEALRRYRGRGSSAPVSPNAETQSQLSGAPLSASGGVGFDPVCSVKKLFGKLSGTTFYLYRTWDARGERPMLTDRPIDPDRYLSNPDFRYELVGKYSGECEALAAWRTALREATAPPPLPAEEWRGEPADPPPPE